MSVSPPSLGPVNACRVARAVHHKRIVPLSHARRESPPAKIRQPQPHPKAAPLLPGSAPFFTKRLLTVVVLRRLVRLLQNALVVPLALDVLGNF